MKKIKPKVKGIEKIVRTQFLMEGTSMAWREIIIDKINEIIEFITPIKK